jgi:hypothetical protein
MEMLMRSQVAPIQVFSVADFGINLAKFLRTFRPIFYDLPLDHYDAKREQLIFLQKTCADIQDDPKVQQDFFSYYKGEVAFSALQPYFDRLLAHEKEEFSKIKPYRRRAVSRFSIKRDGGKWQQKRIPTAPFSQDYGKIDQKQFDFRLLPRIFSEIDEKHVEHPLFSQLIEGLSKTVGNYHPEISALDITVHHVLVETSKERVTSNSPEGIHQDGFDYIVSALVMERNNVLGGESQIFEEDKTTKILRTTLQPGQGMLQPDKDTHLWHKVTEIVVKKPKKVPETLGAFRSSIGFDIALVK